MKSQGICLDCLTLVLNAQTLQESSGRPYGTDETGSSRQLYGCREAVGWERAGEEVSRRVHNKLLSSGVRRQEYPNTHLPEGVGLQGTTPCVS